MFIATLYNKRGDKNTPSRMRGQGELMRAQPAFLYKKCRRKNRRRKENTDQKGASPGVADSGVGISVGTAVGSGEGDSVGAAVGSGEGVSVGAAVGSGEGDSVGATVGASVGRSTTTGGVHT